MVTTLKLLKKLRCLYKKSLESPPKDFECYNFFCYCIFAGAATGGVL